MGVMDILDMADMLDIDDIPEMVEKLVSRRETMVMEEAVVLDRLIDPGRPAVESVEVLDHVAFDCMEAEVFRRWTDGFISCCDTVGDIWVCLSDPDPSFFG